MAIANRLLAVEDWASEGGGLYYRRMATLALQLACTPPSGPPRNSGQFLRRLDHKKLQQLWRGDATAQADLEQLAADPTVLAGVRGRYSAFFRSLAGTADGRWGLEDVDLAVLTIPTIASRQDADAAVRLVLEDLGHFATKRKARVGDDVLLVLDEFSAVQGGTDQAIHLAERLRDVGVPIVFGAQSPEGLGDERQQWRLLHTLGGGLVLHQLPDPDRLIELAGTIRVAEQAWQLDPWGPAGQARVHMADRPRVDPNQVRQLHPGEAFLIQAGRAVKLSVLQAPVSAQVQEEASALRATAMSAAEPVYVAENIVGAPPQVERWQPPQPALDQPEETAPLLALAAPTDGGQTTQPVQVPALPATPPPRAPASCSPSAKRSPPATRPPSPPSSKQAGASNPTGTPPTSWSALGPLAGGGAGGDGPASPGGWPGSPTWGGCAMTDRCRRAGGRGPHLPVLTVHDACRCPPRVGHPTPQRRPRLSPGPISRPRGRSHAGRLQRRPDLPIPARSLVLDHPPRGARNDLHAPAALPCGDPDRSAAPHGPAVCLLDGLPPRPLRGQGSLRAHECSLRLRRPLDRSGVEAARRHRSPGAGEDPSPTSSQHKEAAMQQFEQDWLEVGSRLARSLHYHHPRNPRLLQAAKAEAQEDRAGRQEWTQSEGTTNAPRPRATRTTTPEEVMALTPPSIP
jgi:hypothetical protein